MEHPEPSSIEIRRYNTRLGLWLFLVYTSLYVGFVLINTFAADTMDMIVFAGLNLAIVYGFGLILAALVMALIYGAMCRTEPVARLDRAVRDDQPQGSRGGSR